MTLHKRIRRVFLENKAQYFGSILLIFLSTYAFTMMTQFADNFGRLVNQFEVNHAQEDATFTTENPIGNIQELERAADALIEEGLTVDYRLAEGQTLRLFSQSEKINIPAVLEGTGLGASGEILLGQYFAAANGYKINDEIELTGRNFTVVGFMTQPNYMYPVQSESDLLPSPNFGTALISREDFAAFDQASTFYAVKLSDTTGENPFARAVHFREILSRSDVNVLQWTDIENSRRVNIVRAEVQILNLVSKAMPSGILLLATLMVSNVIWRMIKRESRIIGALYALGFKRAEIYRHYLIFPLLIALTGGIFGTIAGTFLVGIMVSFFLMLFIVPPTGIELNPLVMLLSPMLPLIFLGISGYFVIQSELKHSPVQLMRGREDESKISFLERITRLEGFGFGTRFAIRQQVRSLSRVVFLLIGVAVATMLLLWATFLKTSTDFLVAGVSDVYNFEYEYAFPELRFDPLPAGAEPFAAALFLPDAFSSRDFHINGIVSGSTVVTLADASGASLSTDQVIITRPLAEQMGVNEGDTASVVRRLDGRTFSVQIDRIADTYSGNFIFMPLEMFNQTFGMPEGSYNGVFSNARLNIPENEPHSVVTLEQKISGLQELIGMVAVMIGVVAVIAFAVGVIVIYVVTSLVVEENRNIIALMKVVGYRKQEINALILNSSTPVVVIGYLIGIPLTISAVGVLIGTMEDMVGLAFPPASISLPYLLIGFIVVMLAFELSKRMSRKKVAAVPMGEALKANME